MTVHYHSCKTSYRKSGGNTKGGQTERLSIPNENLDFRNLVVNHTNFLKPRNADIHVRHKEKHVKRKR